MHSLPSSASSLRIATLLLTAALWIAAPLQNATAGDALTTSSTSSSSTTRTGILSSLFGNKSSSSSTSSSTSSSSQVSRSILGLPLGILKSAYSTVSKAASTTVSSHIKTN